MTQLLLWLGIALVRLDPIARALALGIVDTHDLLTLSDADTVQELRRRYASLAIQTGLPLDAQGQVADMAWRYVAQVRDDTPPGTVGHYFSFYR